MPGNISRKEGRLQINREKKIVKVFYPDRKRPDKEKQLRVTMEIPPEYDGKQVEFVVEDGNKVIEVKIRDTGEVFRMEKYQRDYSKDKNRREEWSKGGGHGTVRSSGKKHGGANGDRPTFYLPSLVKGIVESLYEDDNKLKWVNPALVLYKYSPGGPVNGEIFSTKIGQIHFEKFSRIFSRQEEFHGLLKQQQSFLVKNLDEHRFCYEKKIFRVLWRLAVGLGTNHPYEVSMKLHHIYGVPIIPGSALKGVARDMALLKILENKGCPENTQGDEECTHSKIEKGIQQMLNDREKRDSFFDKISNKPFKELSYEEKLLLAFGNQQFSGIVVFLDAIPDSAPKFKVDIMNPHYPEYYQGKNFPTDWQNPNPIKFLTVENTKFRFTVLVNKARLNRNDKDDYAKDVANYAWGVLKEALENLGVGAKTSVGYGYFNEG